MLEPAIPAFFPVPSSTLDSPELTSMVSLSSCDVGKGATERWSGVC